MQGEYLNTVASKTVKVLVVGNPANTNALIAAECAPNIPKGKNLYTIFHDVIQLKKRRTSTLSFTLSIEKIAREAVVRSTDASVPVLILLVPT